MPQLKQQSDAHIVNISSIFGIISVPSQSAYNASKFAVKGFTESLRQELNGSKIHVTCVHPGGIKTNIVRHARIHNDISGHAVSPQKLAADFDKMASTSAEEALVKLSVPLKKIKGRAVSSGDVCNDGTALWTNDTDDSAASTVGCGDCE